MASKPTIRSVPEKKQYHFLIILTVILMGLSFLSIVLFGKTCSLDFAVRDPDSVSVEYDHNIIECIGQHFSEGILTMEFRGVSRGDTFLIVDDDPFDQLSQQVRIYVHPSGILTRDNFFGKCSGDIAFSVSVTVILLTILLMLRRKYSISSRENLCRYVNTRLLGAVIFLAVTVSEQVSSLVLLDQFGETPSVMYSMEQTMHSAQIFSMILLPLAIIISLAISISNLVLLKREGFRLKNMLGFFLGIVLCVGSFASDIMYALMEAMGVDVHRYASFAVPLCNCAEAVFAVVLAYLESMLIGTAISALRVARHIPAFDKDYILILGCQIRKDGGLTKLLQSRADRAIAFAKMQKEKTGKEITFVPSGGKGTDEVIAEAEAIRNYLISAGIPEERVLVENQSATTSQNLRFSHELICQRNPEAKTAFSTTNYHVFRAGCYAEEAGIPMEGIGAKTKPYFWINAFIREYIAGLHYEKRKHIRNLVLILCAILPFEILLYISMLY